MSSSTDSPTVTDSLNEKEHQKAYESALIGSIFSLKETNTGNGTESVHVQRPSMNVAEESALGIYQNNFIENGIRALAITFPTVEGLISPESFRILAKHYLLSEYKTAFDWADYGESMADFIDEQEALADSPFLSECAELDWLIHRIQRQVDKDFLPQSFAKLESDDINELTFVPAPGLTIMPSWFPVVDLYQLIHDPYLQSEDGVLARQKLLKNITKSINNAINSTPPRSLVLWRAEYKAEFEYLSDAEALVVQQILDKHSVAQVIETLSKHEIDITSWLTEAIQKQRIFAVE